MKRTGRTRSFLTVVTVLIATFGGGVVGATSASAVPSNTRCGDSGTPSVVALQDPHFYIDTASTAQLYSGYSGYTVRAGATARRGLWLQYSDFTGGVLGLAAQQAAATPLPDLAGGDSSTRYALMTATGPTTVPQSHVVTLYAGRPGSGVALCSRTFTYADVVDTIKALANKVTGVVAAPNPTTGTIGDAVVVTVTGNTGTLGAGPANDPGVLSYTPNALSGFPASAWRLERTELTVSPDGNAAQQTYVDRLFLTGASGAARPYTARYTFRAVGPSTAPAQLKPIQYIASGTQVKHTDQGGPALYSLPPVSSIATTSTSKTLTSPSPGVLPAGGGTAAYAVTLTNASTAPATVDWVEDTLPTDATYVAGSLRLDGRLVANPTITGRQLVVEGPLTVPAAGSSRMTYEVTLGVTSGIRTNSAVAHFGDVRLDSTPDVTNQVPATASVTVLGTAALNLAADTASTPAGTSVSVDVLANDTAPSGLPLTLTQVAAPSSGSAVVRTDGRVAYSPAAGFSGRATFTYTATDGYTTGTAVATVTVSPVAVRDTYSTGPTTALVVPGASSAPKVLANDACTSCTVSATLVSGPVLNGAAYGTVAMSSDGSFTYTPGGSTVGVVTFTYRATDPVTGLTTDGVVVVNVAQLAPDLATTLNATAVSIDVQVNDPGCTGGCRPQAGTPPGRGSAVYSNNSGSVVYTPTGVLWGLDSFAYGVTGNTGSLTTPVTVLVGPPASTLQTTYGTAATLSLPGSGSCTGCTYLPGTSPVHGSVTVNATTGQSTYAPEAGYAGTDTFTYVVRDPVSGLRVTGSVTVTVGPNAVDDTATVLLGSSTTIDAVANDSCPATCTTSTPLTQPTSGSVVRTSGGQYTYTSGTAVGQVEFTYGITSSLSGSLSDTATVRVQVMGARDDTATTPAGTSVLVDVRANDPCTACTLGTVGTPTSGTAVAEAGGIRYQPAPGFTGQATLTYQLVLAGGTTPASVVVTVLPQGANDTATTVSGTAVQVLPLANDLCGGCVLTSLGTPSSGTVSRSGDVVTFTPSATGTATFSYTGVDSFGSTVTGTVTVSVVAPPALVNDTFTTPAGTPAVVAVLANDTCSGCVVAVDLDPARGTVSIDVAGRAVYSAAPGFSGVDTFRYSATDPVTGAYATALVTITVLPVAPDDAAATGVGQVVTVAVLANDTCTGCTVTVTSFANGTATVVGGAVQVTPSTGFVGTLTVPYTATDATGNQSSAMLVVVVSDARPDAATTAFQTPVTVDVIANDICNLCSVTAVPVLPSGSATFTGREVTFTPATGFSGLAVITYTASDGNGRSVSSTLRVLVAPAARSLTVVAGGSGTLPGFGTGDCTGCVVTLVAPPVLGEVTGTGGGGWSYTAAVGQSGQETFRYRITDPVSGLWVEVTVTVDVTAAPVPSVSVTGATGTIASRPSAGDVVTVTWTVTNDGATSLTGVVLDAGGATLTCTPSLPAALAINASAVCTTPHTLTQPQIDAGQLALTATATAAGPITDAGSVTTPLTRVRAVSLSAAAVVGGASAGVVVGDPVGLTYTATNTGNTTLDGVTTTITGRTPCTAVTLAPGGTALCAGTHALTQPDIMAGSWSSTGQVVGTARTASEQVSATAGTTSPLVALPVVGPGPVVNPSPPVVPPSIVPAPTTPTSPLAVDRIAGADRTRTAAALALESFPEPDSAQVVVLARDDVFADGLAGSPLAGTLIGPLLLTNSLALSVPAAEAIDVVLAPGGTVFVLGGPRAVSPGVVAELTGLGYAVERIGGTDRFHTATLIADRIGRERPIARVFLATGMTFPDALSASSAAGLTDGVVVLTAGTAMPATTAGWLARHAGLRTTAVGGGAAAAAPGAEALVGSDRYVTAARVAGAVAGQAEGLVLATGADFPDGLAAASYASARSWPMLLVDPRATSLNSAQSTYLDQVRAGVREMTIVGGTTAVPDAAADLVRRRLG